MSLWRLLTRTLSARLFILSSIWAIVSVSAVAFFISTGYRDNSERRLQELLTANIYALMANVEPDKDGKLIGSPDLRDARFLKFQSGFYWSVTEMKNPSNLLVSTSLVDGKILQNLSVDFDSNFERTFNTTDNAGNNLIGVEAQVFLGEGDDVYSFKITGNKGSLDGDVSEFTRQLLVSLFLFALGFILVSYFLVRWGLSPLGEISNSLSDIREGKATKLEGEFPSEVQPLVDEANSLIHSNNVVVERARTQVGNLAHSLKTPLAVLKNEAGNTKPQIRSLIEGQIEQMQSQIQTYLDRARIAARVGSVTSRTQVTPVVERLVRVMNKLNPELDFSVVNNNNSDLAF
ncbi:MAG: HAMP domain-containing histidine kinase, partial [Rhizobiales bacterium]|nr:HAMP domain-containing histidine kinase [Hyphomicrobiales bacterium]